jgi:hypothetical protein
MQKSTKEQHRQNKSIVTKQTMHEIATAMHCKA